MIAQLHFSPQDIPPKHGIWVVNTLPYWVFEAMLKYTDVCYLTDSWALCWMNDRGGAYCFFMKSFWPLIGWVWLRTWAISYTPDPSASTSFPGFLSSILDALYSDNVELW